MTNIELVNKAMDIAEHYKTLYVMGCFGAPMTDNNKKRYTQNHEYNTRAERKNMILSATSDTFGFDCVCLLKGIVWGWNGDKNATYGGASYNTKVIPDLSADQMVTKCYNTSTDFTQIEKGEYLWKSGHAGIYVGDGLAVECTPAWKNCVQVTAVGNIGYKAGYNSRIWTKHGKLPYIEYVEESEDEPVKRYDRIEEVPEYARPTIEKLCKMGAITGTYRNIDRDGLPTSMALSEDMLRTLVIIDRAVNFSA